MEACMMSHEESDFNYKEKKNKIGVFNWYFSLVPVSTRKNTAFFAVSFS